MDDGKCSAYVSAGHMVFFAGGLSGQLKKDVIDSVLYSQLSASEKHSRFSGVDHWSIKYKAVMGLFGWLTLQERTRSYSDGESMTSGVAHVVEEMLERSVSDSCVDQLKKLCTHLKSSSPGHTGLQLLLEHALDSQADRGDTTLTLLISFVSPASLMTTVFLSSKIVTPNDQSAISAHLAARRSVGSLSVTVSSMELVERQYRRVRERVSVELGASRDDLVMALDGGHS